MLNMWFQQDRGKIVHFFNTNAHAHVLFSYACCLNYYYFKKTNDTKTLKLIFPLVLYVVFM